MEEVSYRCTLSKKPKLTFNTDTCCFCKKALENNKVILNHANFDCLLSVCRNKNNELSSNIVASQKKK